MGAEAVRVDLLGTSDARPHSMTMENGYEAEVAFCQLRVRQIERSLAMLDAALARDPTQVAERELGQHVAHEKANLAYYTKRLSGLGLPVH